MPLEPVSHAAEGARRDGALAALLTGTVAGLVAAAVMSAAQEAYLRLTAQDEGGGEENATTRTADMAAQVVTGAPVPQRWRAGAGEAVHYGLGAVLGGAYGLSTHWSSRTSAGFGTLYGVAVALALDETAVPAMGLGPSPARTPLATHLYSLASHVVFGASLEVARRGLGGRR